MENYEYPQREIKHSHLNNRIPKFDFVKAIVKLLGDLNSAMLS